MAKNQYILTGRSAWMGASGNALFSIVNTVGSGKKISIQSFSIFNQNRLGFNQGSNTQTPASSITRLISVSALSPGELLTPTPLNAGSWPATVRCSTLSGATPTMVQIGPSYVASGVTAGAATFTPTTTSIPAWFTNEHQIANRYLVVSSGGNAGTYRVLSNTATALTLTTNWLSTVSTTGYIGEPKIYAQGGILKTLRTDTTSGFPTHGRGSFSLREIGSGVIYDANTSTSAIIVKQGEKVALVCDYPNASNPLFVSVVMVRSGSPNKTFVLDFYTQMTGEWDSLFAIDNNAGSGETITITYIAVSEVGTLDTCYFQLVPIASVHPMAYLDSTREITSNVTKFVSSAPTFDSSVGRVFVNTPVLPFGVPISYVAEGSAGGVPKGFNYLNTKDFIGPVYMVYFPEGAAFKPTDYSTTYWSTATPGTLGSHNSIELSTIKGPRAPIVIREGEGIALVSGAETAVSATLNSVSISGWEAYEFSVVLIVENARVPTLTLAGMIPNSRYEVLTYSTNPDSGTVLFSGTTASGTEALTFTAEVPQQIKIRVRKSSTSPKYQPYEIITTMTQADQSVPVSQVSDTIAV